VEYCLHAVWDIRQGGAEDWYAPIIVGAIKTAWKLSDTVIVDLPYGYHDICQASCR
jgi:hypothetical protein